MRVKIARTTAKGVKNEKVELSCGNVFADLGFHDAEERLLKAELATRILHLIKGHCQLNFLQTQNRNGDETKALFVIGSNYDQSY